MAPLDRDHTQPDHAEEPAIRRLALADLQAALDGGWEDFGRLPAANLLVVAVAPAVALASARIGAATGLLPMLYPLATGFTLLGPLASVGFYEIARRREQEGDVGWTGALGVFRRETALPLALVGALLLAIFAGWMLAARGVLLATLGADAPTALLSFIDAIVTTPEGWRMALFGNAVGLLFGIAALGAGAFSLPLIVDGERSARRALRLSLRAVAANAPAMLAWGAVAGGLMLVSILLGAVGVLVSLPVLAHATWRLYRRALPAASAAG